MGKTVRGEDYRNRLSQSPIFKIMAKKKMRSLNSFPLSLNHPYESYRKTPGFLKSGDFKT